MQAKQQCCFRGHLVALVLIAKRMNLSVLVPFVQAKLLEAVAGQREAARQLEASQQASDSERAHLEQLVRRSKEEGTVRIQTLEETIRKLGNRSDLHQVGCVPCCAMSQSCFIACYCTGRGPKTMAPLACCTRKCAGLQGCNVGIPSVAAVKDPAMMPHPCLNVEQNMLNMLNGRWVITVPQSIDKTICDTKGKDDNYTYHGQSKFYSMFPNNSMDSNKIQYCRYYSYTVSCRIAFMFAWLFDNQHSNGATQPQDILYYKLLKKFFLQKQTLPMCVC